MCPFPNVSVSEEKLEKCPNMFQVNDIGGSWKWVRGLLWIHNQDLCGTCNVTTELFLQAIAIKIVVFGPSKSQENLGVYTSKFTAK